MSGLPAAARRTATATPGAAQVLADRVDSEARVAGWVHRRRDHGGLIFIDLRDRTGIVQLVFHPDSSGEAFELGAQAARRGRAERRRDGRAPLRGDGQPGAADRRGRARASTSAELLADAETPPFQIEGFSGEVGEDARLRHRYLDLRREPMREALALRHRVTAAMREFLDGEGFLDIETPVLTRSTPEGARDFLVPSRLQRGSFYALPQSPQLFKQLLMVAGFERYYQIARCFRDEDLRADRQPDFTQLDIEMSFVDVDDVIELNERLLAHVFERVGGPAIELPIERLPYDEAMDRFGTDRPDMRFGLELVDLADALARDRVQGLPLGDRLRRRGARAERRPPRAAALRARRADLPRPGAGGKGPGLGVPRGRGLALADREVPQRG